MPRARSAAKGTKPTRSAKKSSKATPNKANKSVRSLGVEASLSLLRSAPQPERIDQIIPQISFDANCIRTYYELLAALDARVVQITLGANIIAENNILINYDVAINFNGYSIISEESRPAARVLDIRSGEVTLTGQGKVFAMGKNSVAIRAFGAISTGVPNYTSVTIDEGISLFAPDSYAILISPNLGVAYGLTINFSGQIFARDGICLSGGIRAYDINAPVINLKNGARITADEEAGTVIEAAGYGQWHIGAAYLRGAIGAALSKGILDCKNTRVLAAHGEAWRIMEDADAMLEVTIDGGNYGSEGSSVIAGIPSTIKKFSAKNCELYSPVEVIAPEFSKIIKQKNLTSSNDLSTLQESFTISKPQPFVSPIEPASSAPVVPLVESAPPTLQPAAPLLELTDDATDEQEIISELIAQAEPTETSTKTHQETASTSPTLAPAPPAPAVFQPAPEPAIPFTSEQDAARRALTEAIMDIRKLSAEDYDTGFTELEQAIRYAEKILANPLASLTEICEAASSLLTAFDGLEEHDESMLSDDELDELFYHGAVLQEMLRESKPSKSTKKFRKHKFSSPRKTFLPEATPLAFMDVTRLSTTIAPRPLAPPKPQITTPSDSNPNLASNFSRLSEVLTTISGLDLNKYTLASQEILLNTLAQAQAVLNNPQSSQDTIDELATKLNVEMSQLVPLRQAHVARTDYRPELTSPAPTFGELPPSVMIDEMTPNTVWSLGVTMIDEMTPFSTDSTTREKMLRAMQSRTTILRQAITRPFRKLAKSLRAGLRAGFDAYRDTLHAMQNN